MDDFNRIFEKAKQIEVQLSDEKKNHKETKLKYNDLVSQNEVEKKNVLSLRREKEELIRNYDESLVLRNFLPVFYWCFFR